MITFDGQDHELSPAALVIRYAKEGEHPKWTYCNWRDEVINGNTMIGYWEWVLVQVFDEHHGIQRDKREAI